MFGRRFNPHDPAGETRRAPGPHALPLRAWWRVAVRTFQAIQRDYLPIVAAGCAFFALLSMFPAITAMVAAYGLIADPGDVSGHLQGLEGVLPEDAYSLVLAEVQRLAAQSPTSLGIGFALTVSLSLWSAGRVSRAIMGALNIVNDEQEKRNLLVMNLQVVALTAAGLLFALMALLLIAVVPPLLSALGLDTAGSLIGIVRWPLMGLLLALGAGIVYRMAPSRSPALAAWVVPGALLAALLCLVVSWGFSSYVSLFGGFSRTYGSFGALVVLLLWFYFSFFAILLGAELNAELEHELVPDSTADGPDRLGRRGARMADRVAAWEGDGANPPTPGADGRTGAEGRR